MSEIMFWSLSDRDKRLSHDTQNGAIEEWYGDLAPPDHMQPGDLPETLELVGWARSVVNTESFAKAMVESLLENLDENFGDPDGGYSDVTPKMLEAALVFVKVVLSEYVVWSCEPVERVQVSVREWLEDSSDPQAREYLALLPARSGGQG